MDMDSFISTLQKSILLSEADKEVISLGWDGAYEAALRVNSEMPGIGFLSMRRRWNAFILVCHHLDQMVSEGAVSVEQTQLAISILRLINKNFAKAIAAFDLYYNRVRVSEKSELPRSAREYLAGIEYLGY